MIFLRPKGLLPAAFGPEKKEHPGTSGNPRVNLWNTSALADTESQRRRG